MAISSKLETPLLLAAMPQVQDPFFHESVILLVYHDDEGSFGLIVNRPTELKVVDVLKGLEIVWAGDPQSFAFFGGPVRPQQGTILFANGSDLDIEGASEIYPGVSTTQHFADLAQLAKRPPQGLRLVLGYAGWGEEQLLQEILRNDWIIAPVQTELIFSDEPAAVWQETLKSVGLDPDSLPSWTQTSAGDAN